MWTRRFLKKFYHTETNNLTKSLDDQWRLLDRECSKNEQLFIARTPFYNPIVLNHVINYSRMFQFTLFGTAIRNKSNTLAKHILTNDVFTVQMLNHHVFNNCNIFTYACLIDTKIALQLLNSDKILPLTINTAMCPHPFYCMSFGDYHGYGEERVGLIESVLSSGKFLQGCEVAEITRIFQGFMKSTHCLELIKRSLTHDKLTSEIIENIYVNDVPLLVYYCLSGCSDVLKIFLDSDKVTVEYVFKCRSKLVMSSLSEKVQNVLKTHAKFSHVYDDTSYKLIVIDRSLKN